MTKNKCSKEKKSDIVFETAKFLQLLNGIKYYETEDGHIWLVDKQNELHCITHSESYRVSD